MAIKKSFLATSGIRIDEAYYKVYDIEHLSENVYKALVRIYTNEYQRQTQPDLPLAQNYMTFEADPSAFDAKLSDDENQIKQAYNKLSLKEDFIVTYGDGLSNVPIKKLIKYHYDNNASLSEYQMTNSSVTYPKWGIGISYSKTFSDDEAILDPAKNNGIKRLSLRYNNGAPVRLKSTHLIPNVKENVYDADQISLGERSISISAIVERDFLNTNRIGKGAQEKNNEKDAITFQRAKLNTGLKKIIKEAQVNLLFTNSKHIRPKSYDIYPTQCTYSINSDNQIEFSLGAEYVFKDGRQVKDLGSFFAKDK